MTRPGRLELATFCEAVRQGDDVVGSAQAFGRACCGMLTERELVRCIQALWEGELRGLATDAPTVIAAAREGHRRQAEAYRLTELLVDPLSGLDSESRFVSELWDATSRGRSIWLVVLQTTDGAPRRSWARSLRIGLAYRTVPGREGMVLLASGTVLVRFDAEDTARQCLTDLAERLPDHSGRVVPGAAASSLDELAWWLGGVITAAPETPVHRDGVGSTGEDSDDA